MTQDSLHNTFREEDTAPDEGRRGMFSLLAGLFIALFTLYVFFASISYFFTGDADQSVIEHYFSDFADGDKGIAVENWLGFVGALTAYQFMHNGFGIAGLFVLPVLFLLGLKIAGRGDVFPFSRLTLLLLVSFFWTGVLWGYIAVHLGDGYLHLSGGVFYYLSSFLHMLFGWGMLLLLFLSLFVLSVYYFGWQQSLVTWIRTSLLTRRAPVAQSPELADEEPVVQSQEATTPTVSDQVISQVAADEQEATDTPDEQEAITATNKKNTVAETQETAQRQREDDPVNGGMDNLSTGSSLDDTIEKIKLEVRRSVADVPPSLDEPQKVVAGTLPYEPPSLALLVSPVGGRETVSHRELEEKKNNIVKTLLDFGIEIQQIKATVGSTVTLYEIVPKAGIRISKIKSLEDDIALSLAARGIRIIAPMPGKGTIGIEVPNKQRELVRLRSALSLPIFQQTTHELPIVIGKGISGEVEVVDLTKMPHLLIAGATGQGKSVGLNVLLISLLYKKHPKELKMVLVDPKKVELSIFASIQEKFLARLPNQTDAIIIQKDEVVHSLKALCKEMDNRYDLLKSAGCRNIKEYNGKIKAGTARLGDSHIFLPYLVLVIDELADLMMTDGKSVESYIARLAQLARAVGIHLVVATQRPSVDVITGVIKANFPARLSYYVSSQIDSRTILDVKGAEQLVGAGDLLFSAGSSIVRLQCPYLDTQEVERVCAHIHGQPGGIPPYYLPTVEEENSSIAYEKRAEGARDPLFEEAAHLVVTHQSGSVSWLQRRMSIGFNRAGRLVDQLEKAGVVGAQNGGKPREIKVLSIDDLEKILTP